MTSGTSSGNPRSHPLRTILASLLLALGAATTVLAQDVGKLQLGMTRAQVEKLAGKLVPERQSGFRNTFTAPKQAPDTRSKQFSVAERTLYFDDAGRLWRIRMLFHAADGKPFAPDAALSFYRSLANRVEKSAKLHRIAEQQPVWAPARSCGEARRAHAASAPQPAETASTAGGDAAPIVGEGPMVIFHIACGTVQPWGRTYVSADGTAHDVALAGGSEAASPVAYQVYRTPGGNPDDLRLFQRMKRQVEDKNPGGKTLENRQSDDRRS